MICKKCKSSNVNVQRVSVTSKKRKGLVYWLLFGWAIDAILWLFLTIPRLLIALFVPRKTKTKVHSEAVCQTCGNSWRV